MRLNEAGMKHDYHFKFLKFGKVCAGRWDLHGFRTALPFRSFSVAWCGAKHPNRNVEGMGLPLTLQGTSGCAPRCPSEPRCSPLSHLHLGEFTFSPHGVVQGATLNPLAAAVGVSQVCHEAP